MTTEAPEPPAAEAPKRRRGDTARAWWARLVAPETRNPGALAELRRARSTPEAMRVREGVALAVRLGAGKGSEPSWRDRDAVNLARVLAHVKEDSPAHPMRDAGWKKFAGDLRESDASEETRPRLSEIRFRRLLQTAGGEEKVAAFVRLVALLDGRVNVRTLADDFLAWNDPRWGDGVRERWAFIYYGAGTASPTSTDSDPETDR